MSHIYTVTTNDGKKHKFEHAQKVFDISDARQLYRTYSECPIDMVITNELHISFFIQLTTQISPMIFERLGNDVPLKNTLAVCDRFFIIKDDGFYFLVQFGSELCNEFIWVKCLENIKAIDMSKKHLLKFELCNKEKNQYCQIIRFGYSTNQYWEDKFEEFLSSKNSQNRLENIEHNALSFPDVTVTFKSESIMTENRKEEIYKHVMCFVSSWNSKLLNINKIHDAFVITGDEHSVSIFVDFGNCKPDVLKKLKRYFEKSKIDVDEIILS